MASNKFQFTMLPTNPHFIQPLLPGFHKELSIPVAFLKYLQGTEHTKVKLRGRGGKIWHVKVNGRTFVEGWGHFVHDHDLQVGQILLFRHEKDSIFNVTIFDQSCCQREYTSDLKDVEEDEEEEEDPPSREDVCTDDLNITTRINCTAISSMINYPYFLITITPENARRPSMHIPITFARLHNLTHRCCNITLVDQQERSWLAMLRHKNTTGQIYIGEGWSTFRAANNFKPGDSLLCEMLENDRHIVFKISGSREHHPMKQDAPAGSLLLKNPYFTVIMKETGVKRSHLVSAINIPVSFARLNGLIGRNCEMIIQDETGGLWPATLGYNNGRVCVSKGWIEFARANGIRKGDVFMLELVDAGSLPLMKFHGYCIRGCGHSFWKSGSEQPQNLNAATFFHDHGS